MKKAELLKLLESVPDDADIQVANYDRYDTDEIERIVPPNEYHNWWSRASVQDALDRKIWVIEH